MTIPTQFRINEANVAWRVADGEAVVLHADTSAYFGLNLIGTFLWERLAEQPMTLEQLAVWSRGKFAGVPPDVEREIAAFIEQLHVGALILGEAATAVTEASPAVDEVGSPRRRSWESPEAERFGELEQLILSGE